MKPTPLRYLLCLTALLISQVGFGDTPASGKKYDLFEVGLFGPVNNSGVLGSMTVSSVTQTKAGNGSTIYLIQGTVPANKFGKATKLMAIDVRKASSQTLINNAYTNNLCPIATEKFSCSFSSADNSSLASDSKLYLFIFFDKDFAMYNKDFVVLSDFLTTAGGTTGGTGTGTNTDPIKNCAYIDNSGKCVEVTPKQQLCASGNYILLGGKDCGTACGANQVIKNGQCLCQTGYMKDDKGIGCVVDPNVNPPPPPGSSTTGGGSCSLIRPL